MRQVIDQNPTSGEADKGATITLTTKSSSTGGGTTPGTTNGNSNS